MTMYWPATGAPKFCPFDPEYRRAEAVSEIARRVLARAETAAATEAEADGADAASADDPSVVGAAVKAPISSKRVTAKAARQGPSLALAVLIDFQTLTGGLAANGICELFDGTPMSQDTVRRLA